MRVADDFPEDLKLLFVGINPSLRSGEVGAHFAGASNRFWPALQAAGIVDRRIRTTDGMSAADRAHLHERGIGITNIVPEATRRADELTREQLRAGFAELSEKIDRVRPAAVAVLGVTAWREATGDRHVAMGEQDSPWEGVRLFIAPNPSGLNAHYKPADLARIYGDIAHAAGISGVSPESPATPDQGE
ncbi:mismatch-specific DNA-glycosylase [Corynebacterium doosanense]|uniref:DNA glycosylase n=1 Tax=Corynebacterium doosanense CAU 212 = DSM 45436 TaxID=558173 RepID=A0A097IF30_9CORY|nr:mismatch-specific DNA-glycosylase [Corynebacterium doosanense]AIT60752.1 DNA glycosylase [Corynebacterium doosanense CAU 212 = DSM 45436]